MHTITFLLPNNLGDVIMALPVLEAVRHAQADARISFLVEEGYEGGLVASPYCDRIVRLPRKIIKKSSSTPQWREGLLLLRSIIDEIKSDGCAVTVNLSQHPYLSYITTLIGAPVTYGRRFLREGNHALSDMWSQYLYAIPFARRYNALHATDVYCRIAGVSSGRGGSAVTLTTEERQKGARYLADRGYQPGNMMAVLQPGAAWASKRWPVDAFIELGKKLIGDGFHIVVTGAPAEREAASVIADALAPHGCVTAGELSFRETMALLPFAKFVVSGDTAIMHAAAGLGVKVYALFGPTNPVETGPYGSGHTVFAGRCPSRPCFTADCTTRNCMRSIAPETVYGCIGNAEVGNAGCDIFTTAFPDGVYRLDSQASNTRPCFDIDGAAMTRRAFEPDYIPANAGYEASPERDNSRRFAEQCRLMERALAAFLKNRQPEMLRTFERLRADAVQGEGIAAFWTALLNIRLNSVPLLDPVAGIAGSIEACRSTADQITRGGTP